MPARSTVTSFNPRANDLPDSAEYLREKLREILRRLTCEWRGPFAEGELSDWFLEERKRMHDAHIRALKALVRDAGARGRFSYALEY